MSTFVPREDAMEELITIVQELSLARDLGSIMAIVRHAARKLAGADGATFILREGDRSYYADEEAISPLWKGKRFPMEECIGGWAMLNRKPVIIEDVDADLRAPAEVYQPTFVKSLIVVPIRAADPIGAIGAYWAVKRTLSEKLVKVLQALADTTSVAMENVQLYSELERRIAERTRELEGTTEKLGWQAALLDLAHDAVLARTLHNGDRIIYWNKGAEETYGYSSAEALGKVSHELLRTQFPTEPNAIDGELLKEGQWEGELIHTTRSGKSIVVASRWALQYGGSGKPLIVLEINRDVTEKKRSEEALRLSEERFRLIAENVQDVFWMTTPGVTEVLYVSPAFEKVWGRSYQSVYESPHSYLDAIHPEDRERVIAEQIENTTEGYESEYRIIRPDGAIRWIQDRGFPIRDEQGNIQVLVGVISDITERKEAELATARLATIVESSSDAIISKSLDGIITSWNAGAETIFGYSAHEAIGQPITLLFPEDLLHEERDFLEKVNRGERVESYETERVRKDGKRICVSVTISPIRSGSGRVVGASEINRDITSRKRAEEELRQSQQLLEKTFESLDETVFVLEPVNRTIRACNPAVGWMFGYSEEELIGKNIGILHVSREMYEEFGARMFAALDATGVFRTEYRMRRRNGDIFPTEHSVTEILDEPGKRINLVSVIRDITDRKSAEEELKKYTAKLEQSNRDLEDFAHVASHDLQEPLRKIQAFGDRLNAKYGRSLGDEGTDYLNRMQNASRRMQDLIQSLLKYSRVTTKTEPFTPVDLNVAIREVLYDLEARMEQTGGRVEFGDLPTIEADESQMQQLFQNLIGNALKYIREGEPPVVRIHGEVSDGFCKILVEDNGIGFDEKHLDRIFVPFQRLHGRGEYEGTGMGLAICRRIVERHGGTITAKSQPGKGSTFIVTLPVSQKK